MNRKMVSALTVIFLIILIALLFLYSQSMNDITQAQEETIELVELDYSVDRVNDFDWVTINESYFSLDFIDGEGTQRYAIVAQEGGDIQYYTHQDIISREDAMSITLNENELSELLNTRLGLLNGEAVWEISFKSTNDTLSYYYINAANGEWIQSIANI
ncbi:PepSY domain-containing protein [Aerococcaceae bacterium WGS1372]